MKKGTKCIWSVLCYPALFFTMHLVVTVTYVISILVRNWDLILAAPPDEIVQTLTQILTPEANIQILTLIAYIFTLLIIFLIQRKNWSLFKFWRTGSLNKTAIFCCVMIASGLNLLIMGILNLLEKAQADIFSVFNEQMAELIGDNFIIGIIVIGIVAPFVEEVIFRGIVFDRLKCKMTVSIAIVLQAFIFAIIHFNIIQGVCAFILGIILGILFIRLDSIWAVFIVHSVYNLLSVIFFHVMDSITISLCISFIIIGFAACIFSLSILKKKTSV